MCNCSQEWPRCDNMGTFNYIDTPSHIYKYHLLGVLKGTWDIMDIDRSHRSLAGPAMYLFTGQIGL